MKYTTNQIKQWDTLDSNTGKLVRSLNHKFEPILNRIRNSFGVLIGKYDALDWEND